MAGRLLKNLRGRHCRRCFKRRSSAFGCLSTLLLSLMFWWLLALILPPLGL